MIKKIPYKRRRDNLTDYNKRLKLVKSRLPRAVVRLSNNYVTCQVVNYKEKGDLTIASFNSKELNKHGFKGSKNLPSAYLTGFACGLKSKAKGIKKAILDIGLRQSIKGGRVYASLKGLIDAGISIEHDPKMIPSDERLKGVKLNLDKALDKTKSELLKVIK